jgi:YaiO family outer membrane protein
MTGIYRDDLWYNRAATGIICPVPRTSFALAPLLAALVSSAAAKSEPQRRASDSVTIGIDYNYSTFGGAVDPWHLAMVSLASRQPWGVLNGGVNVAYRFAILGAQYEAGVDPVIGGKSRAFLNAGFSRATIFPAERFGAEVFTLLPHQNEASLGLRHLRFPTEQVTLVTGSVSRTGGSYWVSVRPYFRLRSGGLAASARLSGGHYFADDPDSFVGAHVESGNAGNESLLPSQLSRKRTLAVGLQASRPGSARAVTIWTFNYERDRNPVRTLNRWEFGFGLRLRTYSDDTLRNTPFIASGSNPRRAR